MKSRILGVARKTPDRLRQSRHWLAGKYREVPLALAELRTMLSGQGENARPAAVNPENMIWIFSTSGRSGSTWLRSMMGEMPRHRVWEEPMVGRLFGDFYGRTQTANLRSASFIMGDPIRKGWIRSIRNFVLDGARYVHPLLGFKDYLVIKEPNGSIGAPLLMEALPDSRMIFLVRDPRDVVASTLDGAREGNWLYEWKDEGGWKREALPDNDPDSFVRRRAVTYMQHASKAREAFEAHKGRKVLIKYEDLRADTLGTMRRLYSTLEIPVDEGELARSVEKHSWENIPEEKKGEGKFYRKATPGGWQEDLTPRQAEIVERITAPLLEEFYSVGSDHEFEPPRRRQVSMTPKNRRIVEADRMERRSPNLARTTGRIVKIDLEARRFSWKPDQGRVMVFKFNPGNLKVVLNGETAEPADLSPGQWGKVTYSAKDGTNLARSIEVNPGGIDPENIVWMFGGERTGSTWLATIMGEVEGHIVWFEPWVGELFDPERTQVKHRRGKGFILAPQYRAVWLRSVRNLVLDGAGARFPEMGRESGYLLVKEPHGSVGAPLLMEALPESRMILLVRDPRDVTASVLNAAQRGSWRRERRKEMYGEDDSVADERPENFVETQANAYLRSVGNAKAAFEAHKGRKVLIKYEDLRADTLGTMRRLYSTLEIPVDEGELARSVEKHSWENIPEEKKGEGKFYRKATPGGWQEDLTPRQAEIVERITAPLLEEFYPA